MKTTDLRYIKTEELIIEAFLYYARMYRIADIHIKDICARARISRNAFYGHYDNKYQILDQVYGMIRDRILQEYTPEMIDKLAGSTIRDVSAWCARAVIGSREYLTAVSHCSNRRFRQLIREVFINDTLLSIYENTDAIRENTVLYMMESFISDGLTSTIQVWLDHPDEISEEQFIDTLYEISNDSVRHFYKKLDESGLVRRKKQSV